MTTPTPPCAPDAHCYHAATAVYPVPNRKAITECCCWCETRRVFRWRLEPLPGHGPAAGVAVDWAPDPDPWPAAWPVEGYYTKGRWAR